MSSKIIRYLTGSLDLGYISPVDEGITASGLAILASGLIGNENLMKPSIITQVSWLTIFSTMFACSLGLVVVMKYIK